MVQGYNSKWYYTCTVAYNIKDLYLKEFDTQVGHSSTNLTWTICSYLNV